MKTPPPLIVTLKIDRQSFEFFDRLRRQHFPPERNFLAAHLTLFHNLPGEELEKVSSDLDGISAHQKGFPLDFTGWRLLGKGVAVKIESAPLQVLHGNLMNIWHDWLTAQDKQKLQPHITVQNKVTSDEAKKLYEKLTAELPPPRCGTAEGLQLWHYLGSNWKLEKEFLFVEQAITK